MVKECMPRPWMVSVRHNQNHYLQNNISWWWFCYSLKYPKSQEKKMCGGAIINKVAWNMNCIVYVFDPIHLVYPPGLATWTSPTHMTYLPDIPTWPTQMTCPPDIQSLKFHNTCNVFILCLLFPALCSLCIALFLPWGVWGELHLEWRGGVLSNS